MLENQKQFQMLVKRVKKLFGGYRNSLVHFKTRIFFGKLIQQNNVYYGKGFEFDIDTRDFSILFHQNVVFRDNCVISLRDACELEIGKNVFFNRGASINCRKRIVIGSDCLFGENVKLYDHNHKFRDKDLPIATQGYVHGAIEIGKNCWIGSNVIILKGVTIGDNVVIGANCTIDKSVPSNTIVRSNAQLSFESY